MYVYIRIYIYIYIYIYTCARLRYRYDLLHYQYSKYLLAVLIKQMYPLLFGVFVWSTSARRNTREMIILQTIAVVCFNADR